jgi:hypothetical protein
LQRDKFPRWNVLDSAHLDLLYESILRFDIRRIRSFTPPGLREAGETRFDLSSRNGVGGLAPTAADKFVVGIAWPNSFGARHCEGSLQRADATTVGGGEHILALFKELR